MSNYSDIRASTKVMDNNNVFYNISMEDNNEGKECEYENCSRVLIQLTFCFDIYYTLVDQLIRTAGLLSAQCLVLMAWNLGARDLSSSLESLDSTCIAR